MNSLLHRTDVLSGILYGFIVALSGGLCVLMPRLSRPDLFFAITVQPDFRKSRDGREIMRQYSVWVLVSLVLGTFVGMAGIFGGFSSSSQVLLFIMATGVQVAGLFAALMTARSRARLHQAVPETRREADLRPRPTKPPGGWLAQLAPMLILVAAGLFLGLRWDDVPARFPVHWGIDGHPNGWATRSFMGVYGLLLVGLCTCLLLVLVGASMWRGARRIRASGVPAWQESTFLRLTIWILLGIEYWMAFTFAYMSLLPLTINQSGGGLPLWPVLGLEALVIATIFFVLIRSGQGGWRLAAPGAKTGTSVTIAPTGDRTPDACWKGGLIYYNPEDPALWVEKRLGLGWTLNFGNPSAWLVIGGIFVFVAAVLVISFLGSK